MRNTYSTKEVAIAYKLSVETIKQRATKLGIKPKIGKYGKVFQFTQDEVYRIINSYRQDLKIEVIYVTQTFYIRESKMNFL